MLAFELENYLDSDLIRAIERYLERIRLMLGQHVVAHYLIQN